MMEKQRVEKTRKGMNIKFPSDILVEVLSRLPYKSLCRFTCVSKEWHSLISSPGPGLVKDMRHQRLLQNRPYLYVYSSTRVFYQEYSSVRVSIVDTVNERIKENYSLPIAYCKYFEYIVSCHNIICIIGEIISIHNLSTKETRMLPDSGDFGDLGIGYSSLANEYKVVQWFKEKNDDNFSMGCKIFSISDSLEFKSDSWRLIETRPLECLYRRHPVSVNGVIYWLIHMINHPESYQMDSILAMDLDKEESKIISCPKHDPFAHPHLLELKEFLYVAHCCQLTGIVKMWRLEDPKNYVWVSEYCINFSSMCKTFVPLTSILVDRVENLVFMSLGYHDLLYYNVETGTKRKLDILGHLEKYYMIELPCILKYME